MSGKITNIGERAGNARMIGVKDMLRSAMDDPETERYDKAFVLFLDSSDGMYEVGFRNAGMSMSEALALIEVGKAVILENMGYVNCE